VSETERRLLEEKVAALLKERGVRIFTSACGCCEGVTFALEIDGKMIVDHETDWNFSNF